MKLKLTADTHVLTISGTADSSSGTKQVSGKATIDSWDGGCFSTGGNNLTVVGSLTISG
jgi:hypothetical protein